MGVVKRAVRKARHSVSVRGLIAARVARKGAMASDGKGFYQEGIISTVGAKRTRDRAFLQKGSRELYKSGRELVKDSAALEREAQGPADRGFAALERSLGKGNIDTAIAMRRASMLELRKQKKK